MSATLSPIAIPLREEADGSMRVGQTRVLLELVIDAFNRGDTPETIVQNYDVLELRDVYAVISHYLHHRDEVDQYIDARNRLGDEVRKKIEASQRDLTDFRSRVAAWRAAQGETDVPVSG